MKPAGPNEPFAAAENEEPRQEDDPAGAFALTADKPLRG